VLAKASANTRALHFSQGEYGRPLQRRALELYAERVRLDKIERNAIFKAIAEAGLDPHDFELDLDPEGDVDAEIIHPGSESFFTLKYAAGGWSGDKRVGDRLPWPYDAYAWTALEERLGYWLGEVKSYIETPDLWDELRREREMLQAAPAEAVENSPFTPEEQAEIVKRLREIEEYAKGTYALSDSDRQALEARFDYLEEAVGRLCRLDWRNIALGTLFTLAAEAILPPEAVRHLLLMLFQQIVHLFGGPPFELPGG
jgi:hypothetical protein